MYPFLEKSGVSSSYYYLHDSLLPFFFCRFPMKKYIQCIGHVDNTASQKKGRNTHVSFRHHGHYYLFCVQAWSSMFIHLYGVSLPDLQ